MLLLLRRVLRRCSREIHATAVRRNPARRPAEDLIFGKYLLTTNIVSSGVLMGLGDIVQQEIEYRQGKLVARYDYDRTGRMFLVGLLQGPLHHWIYTWLDRRLPGTDLRTVSKKILFDQLVASPVFISTFFLALAFLERKTLRQGADELRDKFLFVYAADWLVWPLAQFINFQVVAARHRVLYVNGVTMLYNVFLSYAKHGDGAGTAPDPQA